MAYIPYKRGTLLKPSGTDADPDKSHLYVACTDRCGSHQNLYATISTVKDGIHNYPACILQAGEHPFIIKISFVFYAKSEVMHYRHVEKCVTSTYYIPREDLDPEVLERIRTGFLTSRFTPRYIQNYFRQNG